MSGEKTKFMGAYMTDRTGYQSTYRENRHLVTRMARRSIEREFTRQIGGVVTITASHSCILQTEFFLSPFSHHILSFNFRRHFFFFGGGGVSSLFYINFTAQEYHLVSRKMKINNCSK